MVFSVKHVEIPLLCTNPLSETQILLHFVLKSDIHLLKSLAIITPTYHIFSHTILCYQLSFGILNFSLSYICVRCFKLIDFQLVEICCDSNKDEGAKV